jgi:hypothetical protein
VRLHFAAFVAFGLASAIVTLGTIGWWKIAAANAITLATVFSYFQYRHPQVLPRFGAAFATTVEGTRDASGEEPMENELANFPAANRPAK